MSETNRNVQVLYAGTLMPWYVAVARIVADGMHEGGAPDSWANGYIAGATETACALLACDGATDAWQLVERAHKELSVIVDRAASAVPNAPPPAGQSR